MSNPEPGQVTQILLEISAGDKDSVDRLLPLVYAHLQGMAQRQLRKERPYHTLNTTALVHEAYLKLVDQKRVTWQNRAHFFAIAAQAMRRILINYAKRRLAGKRGGGEVLFTFDENVFRKDARSEELVRLDDALTCLAEENERLCKVVEYSFFAGLKHDEIAEILQVSVPTVRRDWRLARAWLTRELKS